MTIGRECEILGGSCFSYQARLLTVAFEVGSRLARIENNAFSACSALKYICIPAGVEFLGSMCFSRCTSLVQLTFESGSRLAEIELGAFQECVLLESICLPGYIEFMPMFCFTSCTSLATVSFEPDSRLNRIDATAFGAWTSLSIIHIPAQLETLESPLFWDCESLTQLTYQTPSKLKRLDLPPSDFGSLRIPDSVEIITGGVGRLANQNRVLDFGHESRLGIIRLDQSSHRWRNSSLLKGAAAVFISLSEEVLRRFRCQFEEV
jgi:hypothetical protein